MSSTIDRIDFDRRQLHRLVLWNRLWIALAVPLTLGLLGGWVNRKIFEEFYELRVFWTANGDLRLQSISDGPFIVTYLVKVQTRSVAKLREPIVIIDSWGATLQRAEFESLDWFSYLNEPHPKAAVGTEVIAFYHRPLQTQSTDSAGSK